ncbi:MAG: hypothetical protein HN348_35815, partial [Proteobacteria bacterium]|nr:hypothetical protein [Pseudomonadota bacterium]
AYTFLSGADLEPVIQIEANSEVDVSDVTLTNGYGPTDPMWFESQGGGILALDSDIKLAGVVIKDSNADNGGGIYQSGGTLSISRSYIQDNNATWEGGGIFALSTELNFEGVDIWDNTADFWGGGLYLENCNNAWIEDSSFYGNISEGDGGGAFVSEGTTTFSNCFFEGNQTAWSGGGIFGYDSTIDIDECFFGSNYATNASAIKVFGGTMTVNETLIEDNLNDSYDSAIDAGFGATLNMTDSLVSDNDGSGVLLGDDSWLFCTGSSTATAGFLRNDQYGLARFSYTSGGGIELDNCDFGDDAVDEKNELGDFYNRISLVTLGNDASGIY